MRRCGPVERRGWLGFRCDTGLLQAGFGGDGTVACAISLRRLGCATQGQKVQLRSETAAVKPV